MDRAESDPTVKAILLVGGGKYFIAGADIREFGQPPQHPTVSSVCQRLESCDKLVVAAIRGVALGGGLEVALGAHYRLAESEAKLGFPEVNLGLLPGGGGTQRAPRLIGVAMALDLMLSGRHIGSVEALSIGLIDRLVEGGDVVAAGLTYARELLEIDAPVRRTRDSTKLSNTASCLAEVEAVHQKLNQKTRDLFASGKIIEAVTAAINRPFDEGKELEGQLFSQCRESLQHAGMVHAFFAEREVAKVPEASIGIPRSCDSIAVVGGGTMGAGIAVTMLNAGLSVVMIERDEESVAHGRANVEKVYDALIAKGRMSEESKSALMSCFVVSDSYDDIRDVDLVIEAVFEDIGVKTDVFKQLDRVCKPGVVLATNTSYLDINVIAQTISRPQDVIGLHFFSPANIMRLLEVVVPARTTPDVVVTAFKLARKLGKVAVRAEVCDGFIGNRILAVYRQAADYLIQDGASPYQVDQAVRAFGFPMGPFQVVDLAGGDIGWAMRQRRAATRDPDARYIHIADRICERGWFGQKTGRGFYRYPEGSRVGLPDPEVLRIVDEERERAGVVPRNFTDDQIMRRYMAAMVNEGANVLYDGIALRPLDIDIVLLFGYGFPRFLGGPMKWADMIGLDQVLADIQEFAKEDPLFWIPSPLLRQLVRERRNFESLNRVN